MAGSRPGRPRSAEPVVKTSVGLPPELHERFRESGLSLSVLVRLGLESLNHDDCVGERLASMLERKGYRLVPPEEEQ